MSHLEADDDVRSPLLALGHDVVHVELVRHLLGDVVHNRLHLDDNVREDEDVDVEEKEVDVHDVVFTFSSRVEDAPPPLPDSLGCSSKTVLKSFSEVAVRKPISAFGWRPYR